jgi:preprotein translocase subunit SecY
MTTPTGLILYILCIFGFAYFYTFIQLKPNELADNLNKNGGYIPGVRPGDETVSYISTVIKKITFVGATALAIIAALPVLFGLFSNMPTSVQIGGTGLLIVVGVALETYKQIESQLISRNYTRGRRKK